MATGVVGELMDGGVVACVVETAVPGGVTIR